jgi:hypothetical protein
MARATACVEQLVSVTALGQVMVQHGIDFLPPIGKCRAVRVELQLPIPAAKQFRLLVMDLDGPLFLFCDGSNGALWEH